MAAKLEVQLNLLNRMSKPLQKATKDVDKLSARIVKTFKKATLEVKKTTVSIRKFATGVNKTASKIFNLRNAVLAYMAISLGKATIGAAASMEVFSNQLLLVSENAAKADKALVAIREFARTSPLETEDVVQSYVRLRAIGLDPTMKQMKTLGGVSVLMNRKMQDTLDAFIGLNKRTLRQLGIDIDRTGKKAIIMSGNIRKEVNKDTASIRRALLETWEERFPDAITKAANTTKAKTAIMKSNIFELSATLGEKFKPAWDKIINKISEAAERYNDFFKTGGHTLTELMMKQDELGIKLDKNGKSLAFWREQTFGASKKIAKLQETENKLKTELLEIGKKITKEERAASGLHQTRLERLKLAFEGKLPKDGKDSLGTGSLGTGSLGTPGGAGGEGSAAKALAAARKQRSMERGAYKEHLAIMLADDKQYFEFKKSQKKEAAELDQIVLNKIVDARTKHNEKVAELNQIVLNKILDARIKHNEKVLSDAEELTDKLASFSERMGTALVAGVGKGAGGVKASLKAVLIVMLDYIRAQMLMAQAANLFSAIIKWNPAAIAAAVAKSVLIAAAFGAAKAGINSFASGTSFASGGMSLVGEKGPELLNVPRGSQVQTAAQTRNFTNNSNMPINITINGNADDRTVHTIRNTLETFAKNFADASRNGYIKRGQFA